MTRTTPTIVVGLCAVVGLLVGCVDKGPRKNAKKIDPAYIQEHLLSAAPTLTNPINGTDGADFGGKVIYLGNNVSSQTLLPGGKITIDHYWRVVEPPGAEWRIFAHVNGAKPQDWMNVDYTDMRVGYPPGKWRAGDIIHDEQKFALEKNWSSPYADVLVGLYRKGGQSIQDRMQVVSGPVDSQQRLKVVRLAVDLGGGVAKPDRYVVRRATAAVTLDGKADEADWKSAIESPDFVAAEGGPTVASGTSARLLWDDQNLYVYVEAIDRDVASQYHKDDDPMWKEDCVEIFIDADGNRAGYVELQVNPHNAKFDAWFAQTRREPSDVTWSAAMTSAVVVSGTIDDSSDADSGWQAEIAIPLAAVKGRDDTMKVTVPPTVGDPWRINVIHIDKPKDGKLLVSSWNAITMGDFHALDRMLTITFGDAEGKAPAPAGARETAVPATGEPPAAQPPTPEIDPKAKAAKLRRELPRKRIDRPAAASEQAP